MRKIVLIDVDLQYFQKYYFFKVLIFILNFIKYFFEEYCFNSINQCYFIFQIVYINFSMFHMDAIIDFTPIDFNISK